MEKVIEELRTCAATLSRIADILAKEPETPTLEEVRSALAELSGNGLTEKIRELIKKHGADRLSGLDPSEYAAVLKEAESLGK